MRLRLIDLAAPVAEPVTVDQVKHAASIDPDITSYNLVLPANITAARQVAEHRTGLVLAPRTKRAEFDCWPVGERLPIASDDAATITLVSVEWFDGTAWQTLDPGNLVATRLSNGLRLEATPTAVLPTLPTYPGPLVRMDVEVAGTCCPQNAALYIIAQAAHWTENPSASTTLRTDPTPFLEHLLDAPRVYG
jgi:uncharacterized phiE125 gp8 family phage protein